VTENSKKFIIALFSAVFIFYGFCVALNAYAIFFPPPGEEEDTIPPEIWDIPDDIVEEATSGSGADINYENPTAIDDTDGDVDVFCDPEPGSTFALGETTVICTATDLHNNVATSEFKITVQDTTEPVFSEIPPDITKEATSSSGAFVFYIAPAVTDIVDGSILTTCSPSSGSAFAIGTAPVACSSTDSAGNSATTNFNITVQDTTPPEIPDISDVTTDTSDSSGKAIDFDLPTAIDIVDGEITVLCNKNSGDNFSVGDTIVNCTATDKSQNSSEKTFKVIVNLIEPPASSGGGGGGGGGLPYFSFSIFLGEHGSINPSSAHVPYGGSQTFVITPNENYQIDNVLVDDVSVGAVTEYIFDNIISNHKISAVFSLIPIPLEDNVVEQEVILPVVLQDVPPVVVAVEEESPPPLLPVEASAQEAEVIEPPQEVIENDIIPADVGVASVSVTMNGFLNSWLWIIILLIILILIALWILDELLSEKEVDNSYL
jgi:hypothetical protein